MGGDQHASELPCFCLSIWCRLFSRSLGFVFVFIFDYFVSFLRLHPNSHLDTLLEGGYETALAHLLRVCFFMFFLVLAHRFFEEC